MGVFDDIKDSVANSEKNESRFGNSDTDNFEDIDFGNSNISQNDSLNSNQRNMDSPRSSSSSGLRKNQNSRQNQNQRTTPTRRAQAPNSQAGRPRPGSDQPQLSKNTQKKMENAGIKRTQNNRETGYNRNRGARSSQSVSDSRNDFEELKAQNEQIIELLKRINTSLQRLG